MKAFQIYTVHRAIYGFLISGILFMNCMPDAERDNPFDPHHRISEEEGQLTGRVTSIYPPFEGIEDVKITLSEPGGLGMTDTDGYYLISSIAAGSYTVMAAKPGYASDSTKTEIAAGQTRTVDFALDGLPYILDRSITSEHQRSLTTGDQFYFHFEVQIDDPDGLSDIDSVHVSIETLVFRQELSRDLNTNWYRLRISPDDFEGSMLEAVVGRETIFSIWDKIGNRIDSTPLFLIRIIYASPSTIVPNEEEKMDSRQLLIWEPFSDEVNFDFTFTVDVLSALSQGWHQENIPSDSTSIAIANPLDSQYPYFWSVWVVDEFGNTSKSPYVTFSVEGGK